MEQATEPLVVGVRFSKVGKIYHFAADAITDIKVSDMVVVETSRGWQLGQVAQIIPNADPPPDGWKPVDRRATPRDLLLRQMWQMKESEVVASCKTRTTDLRLVGIKIVSAEYSFDGARLTIFFSSESEEKYELKSLRSDMQKMFAPSQVELRQIGPRDVAKTHCGMGACGLETRCCCLFLTEFSSISIRMAKEQGISLTPTEITGMCGRLRCCLIYEYDNYVEARAKLPKRNKRVRTAQGEGKVVDVVPLRGAVLVEIPEVGVREFPGDEVQIVDGEGGQQVPAPFKGTQQASEMDQAITGDESKKPFVVSTERPATTSDLEVPPNTEQPRSVPRPDRPRSDRQQMDRSRQPDRPRTDRPRRDQPGSGNVSTGGKDLPEDKLPPGGSAGPRQGSGAGRHGPQGNRPPRREGRPPRQGDQPGTKAGGTPGGGTPGGGTPGGGAQGQRGGSGGPAPSQGGRDQRRRRGRRQGGNDNEERA